MPYALPERQEGTGLRILTTPERIDEESIVWSESKRLSCALRQINTALRRPTDELEASTANHKVRTEKLKNISDDLQTVSKKVVSIVASLGVPPPRPRRFDFITANKDLTFLGKMDIRRARALRQSVEGVEKSESAMQRNIEHQSEKNEQIFASISRRGESKSAVRQLDGALLQSCWLTYLQIARFSRRLALQLRIHRGSRVGSAVRIQRTWRHYVTNSKMLATWAITVISRWVNKFIVRFRAKRKHRAADKIRVFMSETKKVVCICQAVPAFLKFKMKVRNLQASVRVYLESVFALRAKYAAQFERIEDGVLRGLIRENIRQMEKERAESGKPDVKPEKDGRGKKGAVTPVAGRGLGAAGLSGEGPGPARLSKSAQERFTIDWSSITDLSKFRTPDDLKRVVVAAAVRSNRMVFVERKQAWHAAMREYKAHFKQTILFRANVDDFLMSTGQEHRAGALENLVGSVGGANDSFKSLMTKMNRKIPEASPAPPRRPTSNRSPRACRSRARTPQRRRPQPFQPLPDCT